MKAPEKSTSGLTGIQRQYGMGSDERQRRSAALASAKVAERTALDLQAARDVRVAEKRLVKAKRAAELKEDAGDPVPALPVAAGAKPSPRRDPEKRKAYMRELMRKKRAEKKSSSA